MHTDLIYCVVTIITGTTQAYIRSAVTHLTDAANDFSEKTNNNRNSHSTLIYLFLLLCGPPPQEGPHIASHSVCLSVCPSVRPSRQRMYFVYSCTVLRANIQNRKTSVFAYGPASRMQATFRHAQRAAYRTAISAAQILVQFLLHQANTGLKQMALDILRH